MKHLLHKALAVMLSLSLAVGALPVSLAEGMATADLPTATETPAPTTEPTLEPTAEPTPPPTAEPSADPTQQVTAEPSAAPSAEPSVEPSVDPTTQTTTAPTATPVALVPDALCDAALTDGRASWTATAAVPEDAALAYQWQSLAVPASDDPDEREAAWQSIEGATDATFELKDIDEASYAAQYADLRFRCVITAGDQSAATNEVALLPDESWAEDMPTLASLSEPLLAGYATADGFQYTLANGKITVTGYTGTATEVVVPATIEFLPVTAIGSQAFMGLGTVTGVTLPNSVTSIGTSAFQDCALLSSVTLSSDLATIGDQAFYNCPQLKSIAVPDGVTSFGSYMFSGVTPVLYCNMGSTSSTTLCKRGFSITDPTMPTFAFCYSYNNSGVQSGVSLTKYMGTADTVTIPDFVTQISGSAFKSNATLTKVTFSSSLKSIANYAFDGCAALENASLPTDVTSIGSYAFRNCAALASVSLPANLTSIGEYVFYGCSQLQSIVVPDRLSGVGSYAFGYDTGMPILYCAMGSAAATTLSKRSFAFTDPTMPDFALCYLYDSNSVQSGVALRKYLGSGGVVTVPSFVTYINASVFTNKTSVTRVVLPANIATIQSNSFSGCAALQSATLPTNLTTLGSSAFKGCIALENIALPTGLTTLGANAFEGCTALERITLPAGVSTVASSAFSGCTALQSVTLPTNLSSIGGNAFDGCSQLQSLTIPDDVTNVGYNAFGYQQDKVWFYPTLYCGAQSAAALAVTKAGFEFIDPTMPCYTFTRPDESDVTLIKYAGAGGDITLPAFVTKIYDGAFKNVTTLTAITLPSAMTAIGASAFEGCASLQSIALPAGLTTLASGTFKGCAALQSVMLPTGLKTIQYNAFCNCKKLLNIAIPDGVTSVSGSAFGTDDGTAFSIDLYCTLGSAAATALSKASWNFIDPSRPDFAFRYTYDGYTGVQTGIALAQYRGAGGAVTVPDFVTGIRYSAFEGCATLESVLLPDSLTTIGEKAFYNCTKLHSVTIPDGVTSVSYSSFGCYDGQTRFYPALYCAMGSAAATALSKANWNFIDPLTPDFAFRYVYNDYTGAQTGTKLMEYLGEGGDVTVPAAATMIASEVFEGNRTITSVTLQQGLVSIGNSAFYNCTELARLTLPADLQSIGSSAFYGCLKLQSVIVPDGVTSLGYNSFGYEINSNTQYPVLYCSLGSAAATTLSKAGFNFTLQGNPDFAYRYAYDGDGVQTGLALMKYQGADGVTTVPNIATRIGECAFANNAALTAVTLPTTITVIDNGAFQGCASLYRINIPEGCTEIGDSAFSGCKRLGTITLPESLLAIGSAAFNGCQLHATAIPGHVQSIGSYAFARTNIKTVVLPTSLTTLGEDAFSDCDSLTSVVMESPLTKLPANIFTACNTLASVTLPDTVTEIGNYAFNGCQQLESITLPPRLTKLGEGAFSYCEKLSDCALPSTLTEIGEEAFEECRNLTVPRLPQSLTDICERAFAGCAYPGELTLPASVDWLDIDTFYDRKDYEASYRSPLRCIHFMGDAPEYIVESFANIQNPRFYLTYEPGAAGFATPEWLGYPCFPSDDVPAEYLASLTLYAPQTELMCGESMQLTVKDNTGATIRPSNLTWDARYGSIDAYGLYTAYYMSRKVTETVTATLKTDSELVATLSFSIVLEPQEIVLERKTITMGLGDVVTLGASVLPADAAQELVYASNHPEIVDVTADGTLYPRGTGMAKITVRSAYNARVSAECAVVVQIPVTGISISAEGGATELTAGDSLQLTATLTPDNASDKTVVWALDGDVTDAEAVINQAGLLTVKKACQTRSICVTATAQGSARALAATYEVFVTALPPVEDPVKVQSKTGASTVVIGKTLQMLATLQTVAQGKTTVAWTTDAPTEYATISAKGLLSVKAACPANTVIRVTATLTDAAQTEFVGSMDVTAIRLVSKIVFANATEYIYIGQGDDIDLGERYAVTPADASTDVTWKTSNAKIATVDDSGIVIATGLPGSATITATATDGSKKYGKCTVKVCAPVESVAISQKTNQQIVIKGASVTFGATVAPKSAGNKTVVWSVGDEAAPYVTLKNGKLTVKKDFPDDIDPDVTVTATAVGADAPLEDSYTIRVVSGITGIALYRDGSSEPLNLKKEGYLWLGQTESMTLSAVVSPSSAVQTVTWTSSNPKIATVDEGGVVTATGAKGAAVITATSQDGAKKTAKYKVVVGFPAEEITIAPNAQTVVAAGQSLTLKASVLPKTATNKTIDWSVEDEAANYATVKGGKLTIAKTWPQTLDQITVVAQAAGTDDVLTDRVTLSVSQAKAAKVELRAEGSEALLSTRNKLYLWAGSEQESPEECVLCATVWPATAHQDVLWTSGKTSVATVDENGVVTAVGKGTTTIKATAQDGSKKAASCTVVVKQPVEDLALTANNPGLAYGGSVQMGAAVSPSNADSKTVAWSVDGDCATITSRGLLKLTRPVTEPTELTVTAVCDGAPSPISESFTLTAYPKTTSFTLESPAAITLAVGNSEEIAYALSPANAMPLSWRSANGAIATVDEGVVTAVKAGITYVYGEVKDGSRVKRLTVKVTVVN